MRFTKADIKVGMLIEGGVHPVFDKKALLLEKLAQGDDVFLKGAQYPATFTRPQQDGLPKSNFAEISASLDQAKQRLDAIVLSFREARKRR